MTEFTDDKGVSHAPIPIGDIVAAPFVRLPDPSRLFLERAARFRALARDHDLAGYMLFLARLAEAQHLAARDAPPLTPTGGEALARAADHSMPPIDRGRVPRDPAFLETLDLFLATLGRSEIPQSADEARRRLGSADAGSRASYTSAVLGFALPELELAEHLLVAAALQAHLARAASTLDTKSLKPVGDGVCPSCGGLPAASMIVGWKGADGARYCACAHCATLWNYVRIKCVACGSTEGIAQKLVEGHEDAPKAETCTQCSSYVKLLQQNKDPAVDPIADDVASVALDILLKDSEFSRAGQTPFLAGY
jgi:FdhE protein